MTYKLENIPDELDRAIRARAAAEHKSPEETIVDAVARSLGISAHPEKRRDLSDIAGQCTIDDESRAVFQELRRIDPDMWK
jgi:plasmid stability protein